MSFVPKVAAAGVCLAALVGVMWLTDAAGTNATVDLHPSYHWVLTADGVAGSTVRDRAGNLTGKIGRAHV